jgi:hypothetical protein
MLLDLLPRHHYLFTNFPHRYSEILDFHNIEQGNDAGEALVQGAVQGDPTGQAFA